MMRSHIGHLVVRPDGRSLISAGEDDTICIWGLDDYCEKVRQTGHSDSVDTLAIAPQGQVTYSVYGYTLVAFDLDRSTRIGNLTFDHQITTIAVTPTGKQLITGDKLGGLHFVSLQNSCSVIGL